MNDTNPDRDGSDARPTRSEDDTSAQEIAEATSAEVQPDDPWTEPPNSTVDDWFGQRVAADQERADQQSNQQANQQANQQSEE